MAAPTSVSCGGRQDRVETGVLTLSRPVGVLYAAALAVAVLWAMATTWVVVFRDDLVGRLIDRQTEVQYAYEDRLGALRAQMERVTSRKLLEQDSLDGRLAELLSRQAQLESRQSIVASLADVAGAGAVTGSARRSGASAAGAAPPINPLSLAPLGKKPAPLPEAPGAAREASDDHVPKPRPRAAVQGKEDGIDDKLASAARSIRHVEVAQLTTLEHLSHFAQASLLKLRTVVADVGLDPDRLAGSRPRGATGGPFVPLKVDPNAGPFERLVDELQSVVMTAERLNRVAAALPLARPAPSDADITSRFGVRQDPFTRGPAMHTGLDFRAEPGTPVRATGPGRVVSAEYSGGYGNLVEVEHANGIATRYAHLSSIAVEDGQAVSTGTIVGRVGSTGRSTGPHLHYETRMDDDPVDPQRFLRAGAKFRAR